MAEEAYPIATEGAEGAEGDSPLGLPPPPTKKGPDLLDMLMNASAGAAAAKAGAEAIGDQNKADAERVRRKSRDLEELANVDIDAMLNIDDVKQAFNEYDADNNGQIDCAELGAALKKAGKEFTPEQVEAALAKHDKDKDGKLSWGEFQAIFQSDE